MFLNQKNIFNFFFKRKKIGLALGGGNVKGLAHIGVLKVMERHNIPIHCITGTSAGAIVAALYASGLSVERIEEIIMGLEWTKVLFPRISKLGFFSSESIQKFMEKNLPIKYFRETKIPLAISATDISKGQEYVFKGKEESIAFAVRASSNIPGFFNPVHYNDMLLIDGVFTNNLPAAHLKKMGAEINIGVNLIPTESCAGKPDIVFDLLNKANDLKESILVKNKFYPCDILLNPIQEYISIMSRGKKMYEYLIGLGEKEAERNISKIKKYV